MIAPFICWDIDGTLLTTARAGVYALEQATREVTGRPLDLQALPTAGLTDVEIARLILGRAGGCESARVDDFLRIYEDALPASLHRREGRVFPGVREILLELRQRGWGSMLLTGNTRRGAQAKLRHYGLAEFFDFEIGAFSDDTGTRNEIARKAWQAIEAAAPDRRPDCVIVVGDTPHDIACARHIGARCLAVATGSYRSDELQGADAVVPVLDPGAFFGLVQGMCSGTAGQR